MLQVFVSTCIKRAYNENVVILLRRTYEGGRSPCRIGNNLDPKEQPLEIMVPRSQLLRLFASSVMALELLIGSSAFRSPIALTTASRSYSVLSGVSKWDSFVLRVKSFVEITHVIAKTLRRIQTVYMYVAPKQHSLPTSQTVETQ